MYTFVRIVLSFATVGVLLWLFARASRGRLGSLLGGSIGGSRNEPLSVLDRCQLTKGTAVAVVRAGRRHLLLGVGDGGVQLLAEGDDLAAAPDPAPVAAADAGELHDAAPIDLVAPLGPLDDTDRDRPAARPAHFEQKVEQRRQPDPQRAGTRLLGPPGPNPPRTSLIDALREKTVRRS